MRTVSRAATASRLTIALPSAVRTTSPNPSSSRAKRVSARIERQRHRSPADHVDAADKAAALRRLSELSEHSSRPEKRRSFPLRRTRR